MNGQLSLVNPHCSRDNMALLQSSPISSFVAVNSVLAIGGVGGLAVGLAGREILENLFTGLIILSSSPFEVGDEVMFAPPTGPVSQASYSRP